MMVYNIIYGSRGSTPSNPEHVDKELEYWKREEKRRRRKGGDDWIEAHQKVISLEKNETR